MSRKFPHSTQTPFPFLTQRLIPTVVRLLLCGLVGLSTLPARRAQSTIPFAPEATIDRSTPSALPAAPGVLPLAEASGTLDASATEAQPTELPVQAATLGPLSGGIALIAPLPTALIFDRDAPSPRSAYGVAQADFNDDNHLDLAVTGSENRGGLPANGFVYVLLGRGDGSFQDPFRLPLPRTAENKPGYAYGIVAAGLTGDAAVDIAVASPDLQEVLVWKGNGDGSFAQPARHSVDQDQHLDAADVDGDSDLDLISASSSDATISVLRNDGGVFQPRTVHTASSPNIEDVIATDLTGDNRPEIVAAGRTGNQSGEFLLLLNDGSGGFPTIAAQQALNKSPYGFFPGDFDEDNQQDLLVAGIGGCNGIELQYSLRFHQGKGNGEFEDAGADRCYATLGRPWRQYSPSQVVDLNQDGHLDYATTQQDGNLVTIGLGDGSGAFSVTHWVASPGPGFDMEGPIEADNTVIQSLVAGDFNEDGALDLAVAASIPTGPSSRPGGLSLLMGNADGTLRSTRAVPVSDMQVVDFSSAVANVTGDDTPDLLAITQEKLSTSFPRLISTVRGHSAHGFGHERIGPSGAECIHALNTADVDLDGKMDVICASNGTDIATVNFGDGEGIFTGVPLAAPLDIHANWGAGNVGVADFNGDELPDVAVASACAHGCLDGYIVIYLQDPNQLRSFVRQTALVDAGEPEASGYRGFGVGDLDGDGRVDLVTHSMTTNSQRDERLAIYRGNGDGTFAPSLTTPTAMQQRVWQILVRDVSNDGKEDVLLVTGGAFGVLLGNGDGTVQPTVRYGTPSNIHSALRTADIDGDSILDIVMVSSGIYPYALGIYRGLGNGAFGPPLRMATGFNSNETINVADLNQDSHMDLVVTQDRGAYRSTVNLVASGVAYGADRLPNLQVGNISIATSGVPGTPLVVHYTAQNNSPHTVFGYWRDALYLSENETLDTGDYYLGSVAHTSGGQTIGGQGYSGSLTTTVPGLEEGPMHLFVRADATGWLPESEEVDNDARTGIQIAPVVELADGVAQSGQIQDGELRYFRYHSGAASDVLMQLNVERANQVAFYVQQDRLPTPDAFGQKYADATQRQQEFFLQPDIDGWIYLLVQGLGAADGRDFTITARTLGLAVTGVTPSQGSNQGKATLAIQGAKFTGQSQFILANGSERVAVAVATVNSNLATATFDLAGLGPGNYDVVVRNGDTQAALPSSFTVTSAPAGVLKATVQVPSGMRPWWQATATVILENTGDTDIPAPLLMLYAESENVRFLQEDGTSSLVYPFIPTGSGALSAAATDLDLPRTLGGLVPAVLAPHSRIYIHIPFFCPAPVSIALDRQPFRLRLVQITDPAALFIPDEFKADLKPDYVDIAAWDAIWANFTARVGGDLSGLMDALREDMGYLAGLGESKVDFGSLLFFALQGAGLREIATRYHIGAFGRGNPAPWEISASADDNDIVSVKLGATVRRFAKQKNGAYQSAPGDYATLSVVNDHFVLREKNGSQQVFRPDGLLDYMADRLDNRITVGYANGRAASLTFPNGDVQIMTYNGQGLIQTVTDPVGRVTTYNYDSDAHLTTIAGPDGATAFGYANGSPARAHALASITPPDAITEHFSYDDQGRLNHVHTGDNQQPVTIAYMGTGCQTYTDALGQQVTLCHNGFGLPAVLQDGLAHTTRFQYDAAGNLLRMQQPDGRQIRYTYDAKGNLASETDELGQTTRYLHDPIYNRLERPTDPLGNETLYAYDTLGNLTSITYADDSSESFTYTGRGLPASWINRRGQTITYEYDGKDNLTAKKRPDGNFTYGYDGHRNLTAITDPAGTTTYTYDARDRLTSVTQPHGLSLTFTYDNGNRRTQMTDQDGFMVGYSYDDASRLAAVTNGGASIVRYLYDDAGRLVEEEHGNDMVTSYAYDAANQISRIEHRHDDDGLDFFAYTYDPMGRPLTMATPDGVTNFTYDATGQLVQTTLAEGRTIFYLYDAAGNRRRADDAGAATTYTINSLNQVDKAGGVSYGYDDDGNLISRSGGHTYTFDSENRLVAANGPQGAYLYEYDAFGLLRSAERSGVRTHYLIDPFELGEIVAHFDDGGNALSHTIYGIGATAQIGAAGDVAHYAFDATGNTSMLTGDNGALLNRYRYLPFGEVASQSKSMTDPLVFSGRWGVMEEESGLHYMRARWYDSSLGRFVAPDPIGLAGGDANLYRYAGNGPIQYIDPLGLNSSHPSQSGQPTTIWANAWGLFIDNTRSFLEKGWGYDSARGSGFHGFAGIANLLGAYSLAVDTWDFWQISNQYTRGEVAWWQGFEAWGNVSADAAAFMPHPALKFTGVVAPVIDVTSQNFFNWVADRYYRYPQDEQLQRRLEEMVQFCADPANANSERCRLFSERGMNDPHGNKIISNDPNDIIGPSGSGDDRWLASGAVMPYTIFFENKAEASAPAALVRIEQTLDDDVDPATVTFGEVVWADVTMPMASGATHLNGRVDLRAELGLYVDVAAGVNMDSRVITWTLTAIDPETGDLPGPGSLNSGFLFPNDENHRGEGYVTYVVDAKADGVTGAQVDAQAAIIFDFNEVIQTPVYTNTLDGEPPTSSVSSLPAESTSIFQVEWSGQDGTGSGIGIYDVYVRTGDGAPELWQAATPATQATFSGALGQSYAFYSMAADRAGNLEARPDQPDATTTVTGTSSGATTYLPLVTYGSAQIIQATQRTTSSFLPNLSRE